MTARSPSSASAVPESSETVRASSAKRCSTDAPTPLHTSRLLADSAWVGSSTSCDGQFLGAALQFAVGRDLGDQPDSKASAAVIVGLVSTIRSACRSPTS